jgi:hypothetical protein
MAELRTLLTPRLQAEADRLVSALQSEVRWHGDLPVLLYERCWLRLQRVPVQRLALVLPPDASADAPELVRFRTLKRAGLTELEAQQQCWREFGRQACSEALRRYWQRQDLGNRGWTLPAYLELIRHYRRRLEAPGDTPLPLLVLGRQETQEPHRLHWFWPPPPAMRHTCP